MAALHRERLRLYLTLVVVGTLIGFGYSVATTPWPPRASDVLTGYGTAISAGIGFFEIYVFGSSRTRWLASLPFVLIVAVKTLLYCVIVGLVLTRGGATEPSESAVGFSLLVTLFLVVVMQFAQLLGFRTARDLFLGRYRQPRREKRFFLFVDVAGSTGIAEQLGPLDAHRFLAAVFAAAAEPVAACRGEISQYVGDEMVVTWTEAIGSVGARPLRCFFEIEASLSGTDFEKHFAVQPRLRAALHFGEVIAGEVGVWRRAIVFHGDVMNTASRLENATRELGARFIASADAINALGPLSALARVASCTDLGNLTLRGRKEPIRAYSVERAGA